MKVRAAQKGLARALHGMRMVAAVQSNWYLLQQMCCAAFAVGSMLNVHRPSRAARTPHEQG
jgi:hypothetical protein